MPTRSTYRARVVVSVALVLVLSVSALSAWLAAPVWVERFDATGGGAVTESAEVSQSVADLRQRIIDEHLSTASVLVPPEPSEVEPSVRVTVGRHFGIWSILPALVTLGFCIVFREPLPALILGIISGAFILGRYDLTEEVFLPGLASTRSAGIVLLYLWLLGGLLGVWSRTGAALAFADWTCRSFVRGPRSAKLVAWGLGVLFFQGGTISTVLVGTTVRPVTDANRISKEELSYIVDSTASPIASLIAFNAWPGYVQSLIFVPGVAYLATEADRIGFFFKCAPLSFYSIFAVLGTFLLSIDKAPILGRRFRDAIKRSRADDAGGDRQVSATQSVPHVSDPNQPDASEESDPSYRSHPLEFVVPLVVLIGIAVGTAVFMDDGPQVRLGFAVALAVAAGTAIVRGMSLSSLVEGIGSGLKGVTVASVILVLAVVLGGITTELGGGLYLSLAIGDSVPRIAFPAVLFVLTAVIAFATGTSWGTYAIAFPLTMPLAVVLAAGLPEAANLWFVMICFAAVLNGSVFGDQCSPISDTTILSSLVSGCDLMEHVRTQMVPALAAGTCAVVAWTALTLLVT
jgi:Na+/H+ antiporter NhaC